jgi:hypothetical protein
VNEKATEGFGMSIMCCFTERQQQRIMLWDDR